MNNKLLSIELEGFQLFKERQFIDVSSIPDDAILGVFGENNDGQGGYNSNASGKSTLVNAIGWCMFDKIPIQVEKDTAIKREDVVSWGSDKALVSLHYKIGDEEIKFTNIRWANGKKKCILEINGEDFKANTDSQSREKLFTILGLGGKKKDYYTDFLNYCMFSGEVTKGFASKTFSSIDRLKMVARIKKMDVIDLSIARVNVDLKDTTSAIKQLEFMRVGLEKSFDMSIDLKELRTTIIELEEKSLVLKARANTIMKGLKSNEKYNEKELEIQKLETTFTNIESQVDKHVEILQLRVDGLNSAVIELKKKEADYFDVPVGVDDAGLYKDKDDLQKKNKVLSSKLNETKIKFLNIQIETKDLNDEEYLECPACNSDLFLKDKRLNIIDKEAIENHKIHLSGEEKKLNKLFEEIEYKIYDNDMDIAKVEKLLEENHNRITRGKLLGEAVDDLKLKIENTFEEVKDSVVKESDGYVILEAVKDYAAYEGYTETFDSLTKQREELKSISRSQYTYEDLEAQNELIEINSKLVSTSQSKIDQYVDIEVKLKETDEEITERLEIKSQLVEWVDIFTKLKNIELLEIKPQLEEMTNKILADLGVGIEVIYDLDIDSNTLDLDIIEDSGRQIPIPLFSRGQSNRIGLSAGLALRDLSIDYDMDLGFTLWDEVLDGLDNTGQSLFFDILQNVSGLKFVISHDNNLLNYFEYKIRVIRSNHQSKIIMES